MQNVGSGAAGRSANTWRRACAACTKAKRQCTKATPACRRCTEKGVQCIYPPARSPESEMTGVESTEWVEMTAAELSEEVTASPGALFAQPDPSAPGIEQQAPQQQNNQNLPSTGGHIVVSRNHWFLDNHTWDIQHPAPQDGTEVFGGETLQTYVTILQKWLKQWVTEDHSPLTHRYLYRIHMPRCIQDAYTVLTAYLGRTPATKATVCSIIEQRLNQLVQEDVLEMTLNLGAPTPIDHIARVQALLVYQIICLFDGNIRLRACGEQHLPALLSWSDQMWLRISEGIKTGDLFLSLAVTGSRDRFLEPWMLWVFLESARRIWVTCAFLHGVYMTMKEGYAPCPGGLYCTFGTDLWDAKSSHQWRKKAILLKEIFFMQSLNVDELFSATKPDSIDEFGHAVMLISFGLDRMETWKAKER